MGSQLSKDSHRQGAPGFFSTRTPRGSHKSTIAANECFVRGAHPHHTAVRLLLNIQHQKIHACICPLFFNARFHFTLKKIKKKKKKKKKKGKKKKKKKKKKKS